jgi:DNA adenine methylase
MTDLDAALAEANETITGVVLKRAADLFDEIVLDQANELLDDLGVSKRVGAQLWGSTGGKSRIANRLIPLFPEHDTYVEAFAGGAAVFWAKEKKGTEVLNDMDKDIAGALRFVQTCSDAQIAALKKLNWVVSEGHHRALQRSKPNTPAGVFHRMAMLRFGGFMRNPDGGMDRGKIGVTLNLFERLGKAKERLKGVKIHSEDYRKVMSKYDGPNAFFFLDPPYTKTDQNLGERGFDHKAFWEFLGKLKGKFLCTYDAPDPQKKFSLQILEHAVTDGSGGSNRVYKTHVITNYKAKKVESKAPAKKSAELSEDELQDAMVEVLWRAKVAQQATEVQTVILDKKKFKTEADAAKWVKDHKFKTEHGGKGVDETESSWRFRQRDPGDFQEGSFRTISLADGVKAVIGKPKQAKREDDEVEKVVRLLPVEKAEEEERIVFGVVLEPNEVDAQGDTISEDEIRQTAHEWLAKYQNRGLMHRKLVNGKVRIYESYIAPANLTIGGQKVKKGTWLLMYHVPDDEIWQQVKSGKLRGFSMGGFARRVRQKAA